MDHYQDFTYDQQKWEEFPAYVAELHQQMGMKLVLIIDPAVDVTSDAFKHAREQVIQTICQPLSNNLIFNRIKHNNSLM